MDNNFGAKINICNAKEIHTTITGDDISLHFICQKYTQQSKIVSCKPFFSSPYNFLVPLLVTLFDVNGYHIFALVATSVVKTKNHKCK